MSYDQNTVTGSVVRDVLLESAVTRARGDEVPITVAVLGLEYLPPDFDLDQHELDAILAHMDGEPIAASDAPPAGEIESESSEPDTAEPDTAPRLTQEEAQARLRDLVNSLAQARSRVMSLTQTQRAARERLSVSVTAFQVGAGALKTPEQNAREYIASELELRRAHAAGEIAEEDRGGGPGPSMIDKLAFGRGGKAGTRRDSWRRGAYPASMKGAFVGRPKIPSER